MLDKEKKGYLDSEELKNYLTQEGRSINMYLSIGTKNDNDSKRLCLIVYYCNSTHCDYVFVEKHCVVLAYAPGEPFTQEEMDEMLAGLADKEDHRVYYKDLLSQLTIDCDWK